MYDVNYDEFEPVDSSDGGTYSTAMPERKRHVGLAITLTVLTAALCAGIALVNLFTVRIERSDGSTSVIFTERSPDISVSDVPEAPPAADDPVPAPEARNVQRESDAPLQEIYKKLQPCVVSVVPDYSAMDNPAAEGSACTGIVISSDGYIVTCYHAFAQTGAVKVCLPDGTESVAAKVGSDPLTDLAVLKIDAENLDYVDFGDSDRLDVGESVLSLRRCEDARLGGVMTDGIVCAVARDLDFNGRTLSVLQTNACLQHAGYGAPIVNLQGEVVGIRVRSVGTLHDDDLALAVPMACARSIVDDLIENGFIPGQPTLSFKSMPMPASARAYYGLPPGAIVESVEPGGAADLAGIVAGDVIVGIDGQEVGSFEALDSLVKNSYRAGDSVVLSVYRANLSREVKEIYLETTLDEIHR